MLPPPRDASYCLQMGTVIKTKMGKKDMAHSKPGSDGVGTVAPFFAPVGMSVLILISCSLSSALNIRVNFAYIKPDQLPLFRPDLHSLMDSKLKPDPQGILDQLYTISLASYNLVWHTSTSITPHPCDNFSTQTGWFIPPGLCISQLFAPRMSSVPLDL